MMEEINQIEKIARIIETSIPKLKEIKIDFADKIIAKSTELRSLDDSTKLKTIEINKLKENEYRLRANIKNLISNIDSLEAKKNSIKIDEEKVIQIKEDISNAQEELSKVLASMELAKVEKEEVGITTKTMQEEILSLNREKEEKINSTAQLISKLADTNNKYKCADENLKRLTGEQETEEVKLAEKNKELLDGQKRVEEKDKEFMKLSEDFIKLSSVYEEKESDIKKLEQDIINIKSEGNALDEENEQKVKKLRNEENRLLALKKNVLKFILEYKDAGNKAQIAKFAGGVGNAP